MVVSSDEGALTQVPDAMAPHVSVENQLPEDLYDAMGRFIAHHPQWDQYRLVQAAIAGFLFQQGCQERAVAQHYLKGLFNRDERCPDSMSSQR